MSRLLVIIIAALVVTCLPIVQAQQTAAQAEKLLASAQHKAAIDGDLKGAIDDYKKAIAAAGNDRALVAQALFRMAECHQKLGDAEAQAIYERLLRDYSDQQEIAVAARARRVTTAVGRSEEHTSELQSLAYLVCRLLLAPATTETSPLSLHDALPICDRRGGERPRARRAGAVPHGGVPSEARRRGSTGDLRALAARLFRSTGDRSGGACAARHHGRGQIGRAHV